LINKIIWNRGISQVLLVGILEGYAIEKRKYMKIFGLLVSLFNLKV